LLDEATHDIEESEGLAAVRLCAQARARLKALPEYHELLVADRLAGREPFEDRSELIFYLGEPSIERLDLFRRRGR
jgi:hypothetical protein